jgi:hypothetical protein
MRYTGIIDDPTREHVAFVEFDTIEQGELELRDARKHSIAESLTMEVGEPGDETPRWVWKINEDGTLIAVTNVAREAAHNVTFEVAHA